MSVITINVESTDRTERIDPSSFSLTRALTNQADTCQFVVPRTEAGDWKPSILDEVEIVDADSNVIFAGTIVTIEETLDGGIEFVKCQCRDWTFEMDRKLVVKSYTGETVNDIIADIVTSYIGDLGFTDTNVDCTIVIDYIAFNYEYPSKVLQQLAQLVNYDWYVDELKDIHFFAKDATTAPFSLSDDGGNYYIDTLQIKKDATKVKNTITVRGGQYLGDSFTETYVADGEQLTFPLVNKYSGITVTVEGVSQTVGVANLDSLDDYDCLYNFTEKSLTFKPSTKPVGGDTVEIAGSPYVPVLSKRSDGASVGSYGVFEYKIVDTTIDTKEAARERALAELNQFADPLDEGSFETSVNGLETGQLISVNSTFRNISEEFVITRITTTIANPDQLRHKVTISTTQTFGMVEFLQQLLMQKDKEIKIAADEVLDELLSVGDSLTITDSVGIPTTSEPPYFYGSPWLYKKKITVLASQVSGSSVISDYRCLVNLADLGSHFWSNVKTNGGDIRVFDDSGNELPMHLIFIDTATSTGLVRFKGDVDGANNTDFYIWYGNPDASEYARTDTYGSNNVYTSYDMYAELAGELEDHSSNNRTVQKTANASLANDRFGNTNRAYILDSNDVEYKIEVDGSPNVGEDGDQTFSFWVKPNSYVANNYLFDHYNWRMRMANNSNFMFTVGRMTDGSGPTYNITQTDGGASNLANWYRVKGVLHVDTVGGNGYIKLYVNGVLKATTSIGNRQLYFDYGNKDIQWGNSNHGEAVPMPATVGSSDVYRGLQSDDWIATEYANESAPASFYTIGSEEPAIENVGVWGFSTWS